jgi:hypothetical protein
MKTHLVALTFAATYTFFQPTDYPVKEEITTILQQETAARSAYKIYVGKYQMSPNRVLTITEADGQLFGEPTGEQKVKLHPESEHVFTIKEFKGKVMFIVDAKGEVNQALINLQNKDIVAKKIEDK